jgi:hypothetical protein
VEFFGQLEVDVGEVDEDGDVWLAGADGLAELVELAVDAGEMADDFGDAHDGHVFRADDAIEAGGDHAIAAHAEEGAVWPVAASLLQGFNEERAVVLRRWLRRPR